MAYIEEAIKAWADIAHQPKYLGESEHRTVDTFQSVLEGKTSPSAAASTISSLYEPLIKRDPMSWPVGVVWAILCDAARAVGGNIDLTERLVDLLNSIAELPDVTDEHGNAVVPKWKSDGGYWGKLPTFAITFREYGLVIESEEDDIDYDWDGQTAPLLNATTFGAVYLDRGKPSANMPYHALFGITSGVEEGYRTPEEYRNGAIFIPSAATWFLIAGKKIYELCKSNHRRKDGLRYFFGEKQDHEWREDSGYCLERWAFWRKRFGEIKMTQGLRDDVKDIAGRAFIKMGEVESQMK